MPENNGISAKTKSWHFVTAQVTLFLIIFSALFGGYKYAMADLDKKYDKTYYAKEKGNKLENIVGQLTEISQSLADGRENSDDYHGNLMRTQFRNGQPVNFENIDRFRLKNNIE